MRNRINNRTVNKTKENKYVIEIIIHSYCCANSIQGKAMSDMTYNLKDARNGHALSVWRPASSKWLRAEIEQLTSFPSYKT